MFLAFKNYFASIHVLGRLMEGLLVFSRVLFFLSYKRLTIEDLFAIDFISENSRSSSNRDDRFDCEFADVLFQTLECLLLLL
jgi:hypothetical protein